MTDAKTIFPLAEIPPPGSPRAEAHPSGVATDARGRPLAHVPGSGAPLPAPTTTVAVTIRDGQRPTRAGRPTRATRGDAAGIGAGPSSVGEHWAGPAPRADVRPSAADRLVAATAATVAMALAVLPFIIRAHYRLATALRCANRCGVCPTCAYRRTRFARLASEAGQRATARGMRYVWASPRAAAAFDALARQLSRGAERFGRGDDDVGDAISSLWARQTGASLPDSVLASLGARTSTHRKGHAPKYAADAGFPLHAVRGLARRLADRRHRAARTSTHGLVDRLASMGSDDPYSVDGVIAYVETIIGGDIGTDAGRAMRRLLSPIRIDRKRRSSTPVAESPLSDRERYAMRCAGPRILALLSRGLDEKAKSYARRVVAEHVPPMV